MPEQRSVTESATATDEPPFDPYDLDAIIKDRGVDVWHWNDPRIIPNQNFSLILAEGGI